MSKLTNQVLLEARNYEKDKIKEIDQDSRPSFHISAPIGWINDPNGFSSFKGEYHLFYQYHPYSVQWGPMHWGHSKTKDFIKWEQLPAALAPDEKYDKDGCFSGSAVEFDGKHALMYTSVIDDILENGEHHIRQTQSIAIGDGINYKKLDCNPVIDSNMLPEGSSPVDFRDPKIWRNGNKFYVVIGSRSEDKSGQILLYESEDLKKWNFVSVIDRSNNEIGRMWECPDIFNIDGKDILIISPQEMKAYELEFHNGNSTVYIIGEFDKDNKTLKREDYKTIDYGLDFYAPQTLESEDGRRIMIAWMQSWENRIIPSDFKWCGMMTLPRELKVKNGKLIQNPVREIENYYTNTQKYNSIAIDKETTLDGISGREIDMTIEVNYGIYREFEIKVAKNSEYETIIRYDNEKNILTFDRSYSGRYDDRVHTRSMQVRDQNGKIKLRLIMDKYSVEIFVNDGEQAMTSTFYTPLEAKDIEFNANGLAEINIEKHDIKL
ncbi:glycoside hydrolase family 32 protein [Clostridium butyricum]|uniref:glycoside hydrolase family 32 protein n=1 Tax=Clostridium butyricum TaxID=1492 RepID=UPI003F901180